MLAVSAILPPYSTDAPPLILVHGSVNAASVWTFWQLARDERQAGIVIDSIPCPLLIVTGTADTQWPCERYQRLWLKADYLSIDGASHWGLVLNRRALETMIPAVLRWLTGALQIPQPIIETADERT